MTGPDGDSGRDGDSGSGVDFVVDAADEHGSPAAEVLADDATPPIRPRRAHLRLGAAVAALVLVLIVVAVHGRQTAPAPRPAARPTSTLPTPVVPSFSSLPVPDDRIDDAVPRMTAPRACPRSAGRPCTTAAAVPAAVDRAVRARFPHVRRRDATSTLRADAATLWSRSYRASGAGLTLQVTVGRGPRDDDVTVSSLDDGRHTTVYVLQVVAGYTVQVRAVARSGVDPHHAAFRLARDARLLAPR